MFLRHDDLLLTYAVVDILLIYKQSEDVSHNIGTDTYNEFDREIGTIIHTSQIALVVIDGHSFL